MAPPKWLTDKLGTRPVLIAATLMMAARFGLIIASRDFRVLRSQPDSSASPMGRSLARCRFFPLSGSAWIITAPFRRYYPRQHPRVRHGASGHPLPFPFRSFPELQRGVEGLRGRLPHGVHPFLIDRKGSPQRYGDGPRRRALTLMFHVELPFCSMISLSYIITATAVILRGGAPCSASPSLHRESCAPGHSSGRPPCP